MEDEQFIELVKMNQDMITYMIQIRDQVAYLKAYTKTIGERMDKLEQVNERLQ